MSGQFSCSIDFKHSHWLNNKHWKTPFDCCQETGRSCLVGYSLRVETKKDTKVYTQFVADLTKDENLLLIETSLENRNDEFLALLSDKLWFVYDSSCCISLDS